MTAATPKHVWLLYVPYLARWVRCEIPTRVLAAMLKHPRVWEGYKLALRELD